MIGRRKRSVTALAAVLGLMVACSDGVDDDPVPIDDESAGPSTDDEPDGEPSSDGSDGPDDEVDR